jgi:hypothetical protein
MCWPSWTGRPPWSEETTGGNRAFTHRRNLEGTVLVGTSRAHSVSMEST